MEKADQGRREKGKKKNEVAKRRKKWFEDSFIASIIAEHLSARLLILQSVFSVGGMWSQLLSCFRTAICHASGMQARVWLVHKQPSCLGMQLKVSVYKKCVH